MRPIHLPTGTPTQRAIAAQGERLRVIAMLASGRVLTTAEVADELHAAHGLSRVASLLARMACHKLVRHEKAIRDGRIVSLWSKAPEHVKPVAPYLEAQRGQRDAACRIALDVLGRGDATIEEVSDALGRSRSFAESVLGELEDAGKIEPRGRTTQRYARKVYGLVGGPVGVAQEPLAGGEKRAGRCSECGVSHRAGTRHFVRRSA